MVLKRRQVEAGRLAAEMQMDGPVLASGLFGFPRRETTVVWSISLHLLSALAEVL